MHTSLASVRIIYALFVICNCHIYYSTYIPVYVYTLYTCLSMCAVRVVIGGDLGKITLLV